MGENAQTLEDQSLFSQVLRQKGTTEVYPAKNMNKRFTHFSSRETRSPWVSILRPHGAEVRITIATILVWTKSKRCTKRSVVTGNLDCTECSCNCSQNHSTYTWLSLCACVAMHTAKGKYYGGKKSFWQLKLRFLLGDTLTRRKWYHEIIITHVFKKA